MSEFDATEKQEVLSVSVTDEGTYYKVGNVHNVLGNGFLITRIEQCEKSGMHSMLPYLRVWSDESVLAEMCQHNVACITYKPISPL